MNEIPCLKDDSCLLQKIIPLAQEINCLEIDKIANVCVHSLPELLGVRSASLYILEETSRMLHLQEHNHSRELNKIVSLNQNHPSPMVMAVNSRQIILTEDIENYNQPVIKRSQRPYSEHYKTRSCAIIPLICQGRVVGVLNLSDKNDDGALDEKHIALIELFAQLVGASIGNIKMFERMQRQACIDGLTGLANHKMFYDTLEKELWRSRRYGGKISLIMIDVDNLKKANDVFGHRAGDKVLKEISNHIKGNVRHIDLAARYGGDEFAVILPNTSLNDAKKVAQRMLDAVAQSTVKWKGSEIKLSISVGLGQYDSNISPEDITSRSDAALYAAKQSGKNTVKVFQN
ncbi:MAG: sensor domain-containing diguanylate cyclase [Phycisphaerae bacterium]|nr:sensor domain-containing diguanylate cyclase [Phycisphaerae bacterium]